MPELNIGDIVARKSYGQDILFKVADIIVEGDRRIVVLKGICYRIEADAPEDDLIVQSDQEISRHNMDMSRKLDKKFRSMAVAGDRNYLYYRSYSKKAMFRNTPKEKALKFTRPGKVLHLDGDKDYLNTCIEQYKKLENYRNSKHFIEAVKEARRYEKNSDTLVIFAGACQSMFNELINAGANFASAPYRVLIHALDPVFICRKIAFAGIDTILDPSEVVGNTITGYEGIGGVQTRGKYRTGYPAEPNWKEK